VPKFLQLIADINTETGNSYQPEEQKSKQIRLVNNNPIHRVDPKQRTPIDPTKQKEGKRKDDCGDSYSDNLNMGTCKL